MRNLKRALSLTLASVMLLGMMVVGASAASFNDADDISNVTAATVLQELGVMIGNDGNFMPEAPVSRAQMAILICRMLYGDKLNVSQFSGTTQYTDVPVYEYYNGYVNLATSLGIINGYGDGRFGPDDTVTTAQAALMLCRGLGYFKANELTGNWGSDALAAIAQATKINMFGDLKLATNDLLSRDNVAEMVFNSMTKAVPVEYSERWGMYYTNNQEVLSGVKFRYNETLGYTNFDLVYKTDTDDCGRPSTTWGVGSLGGAGLDDKGNIKDDAVEMAKVAIRDEFLKAANKTAAVFTAETGAADVAKALNGYKLEDKVASPNTGSYNINNTTKYTSSGSNKTQFETDNIITVTGKITVGGADFENEVEKLTVGNKAGDETVARAIADLTANGRLVEVFAGSDNVVTAIVIVGYELGKVDGIVANNDKTTYTFADSTTYTASYYDYVDETEDDTILVHGSIAEDDYVTLVAINGVLHVYPTTSFTGAQSAYNTDKNTIKVNGKTYDVGAGVNGVVSGSNLGDDFANSTDDANYYVDQYGFVVKSDAIEGETNYAVVDKIALMGASGTGSNKYAEAVLACADGVTRTVKVVEINGVKGKDFDDSNDGLTMSGTSVDGVAIQDTVDDNTTLVDRIVTYTVKDNEYKLTYLDLDSSQTDNFATANKKTATSNQEVVTKGVPAFASNGNKAGNSDTVYIVKSYKAADDYSFAAYTGYQNVPTVTSNNTDAKVTYTAKDNKVKLVYVDAGSADSAVGESQTGDIFYVTNTKITTVKLDADTTIYELEGILNGQEKQVIKVESDNQSVLNGLVKDYLYELDVDDDGYVTDAEKQLTGTSYVYHKMVTGDTLSGSVLAGKNAGEIKNVYVINDGKLASGSAGSARVGDGIYYKVVDASGTAAEQNTIEVLYIVKGSGVLSSDASLTFPAATNMTATIAASDANPTVTIGTVPTMGGTRAVAIGIEIASGKSYAATDTITFSVAKSNSGASITAITTATGVSTVTAGGDVVLKCTGTNTSDWKDLSIVVTAADGTTSITYNITVTATVGS